MLLSCSNVTVGHLSIVNLCHPILLTITKTLTIMGPGPIIDGGGSVQIMMISAAGNLTCKI
jgi:hypothetical protein